MWSGILRICGKRLISSELVVQTRPSVTTNVHLLLDAGSWYIRTRDCIELVSDCEDYTESDVRDGQVPTTTSSEKVLHMLHLLYNI
jgi:hypothetical protein